VAAKAAPQHSISAALMAEGQARETGADIVGQPSKFGAGSAEAQAVAEDVLIEGGARTAENAIVPGQNSRSNSIASGANGGRRAASISSLHSSRTSLSSTTRRKRYGSAMSSPLAVPPPGSDRVVYVDQFGFPCTPTTSLDENGWDTRHQLLCCENELKPKPLRDYFSKPQTERELKRDLKYNPTLSNVSQSLLRSLSLPEVSDRKPTPVCPDAGPPLVPGRHVFGGSMKDRDGMTRMWNDRWHKSIGVLNENLHPDHRTLFSQHSLFEESPTQNWRRYLDMQISPGVWKPIQCKKPSRFPPMGGRLRGRSGTPIPGASP